MRIIRNAERNDTDRSAHTVASDWLDELEPACRLALDRWLDSLAALSPAEWREIERACRTNRDARDAADARLDAEVNRRGLALAAWLVRDQVRTACHCAAPAAAARRGAERAALAVAFAAHLGETDAALLRAPFDSLVGEQRLRLS